MGKTSAKVKNRYNDKTYERLQILVAKGTKQIYIDRATADNVSLSEYTRTALEEHHNNKKGE